MIRITKTRKKTKATKEIDISPICELYLQEIYEFWVTKLIQRFLELANSTKIRQKYRKTSQN